VRRLRRHEPWRSERGFTLPELMIAIVLMGIVLAIASSSWFGVVESNRVTSATNQLGSDMRLAHTKSTNQLATWRVVLAPNRAAEAAGPDYYLVKLGTGGSIDSTISRYLPEDTRVVRNASLLDSGLGALYSALPNGPAANETRTIEFRPDGSMDSLAGDGPVQVTQDGSPAGTINYTETTSRIQVVS
jgi:prepilin-type N-terminal cleavage/methylation domain-containing protein